MTKHPLHQIIKPTPLLSVVMPCYQAGSSVARAIESIQNQSFREWELIVVDDGSTDNSLLEINRLAKNDKRINVHSQDHQGVVVASNAGFSLAKGSYIARMDSDDVSRPQRLERQLAMLESNSGLGAVSCLAHFAGNPVTAGGYAHHVQWTNRCVTPEQIELQRFVDLPVPHPTLMYRRSLIEQFGAYRNGDFPEDYELFLRWLSHGVKIGKVEEELYDWHDPPTRLSRRDSRYDMAAFHASKAPYLAQAIAAAGTSGRELWIWGAGRPARKCARPLEQSWKPASGFIDIDPQKIGRNIQGRPVVADDNLPPTKQAVIVSYVGTRGAREKIQAYLLKSGRIEGRDFWLAA